MVAFFAAACSDDDGFGGTHTLVQCTAPAGWVSTSSDCDDTAPGVNPGVALGCDEVDHDCDGMIDNDFDGDLYSDAGCGGADCNDSDGTINPAQTDMLGNGVDENCDLADGVDGDGDGHASISSGGLDCDDGNSVGYNNQAFWTAEAKSGAFAIAFSEDYKGPAAYRQEGGELMIQSTGTGAAGAVLGWRIWPMTVTRTFDSFFTTGIVAIHAIDDCETLAASAVDLGATSPWDDIIRQGTCLHADVNPGPWDDTIPRKSGARYLGAGFGLGLGIAWGYA